MNDYEPPKQLNMLGTFLLVFTSIITLPILVLIVTAFILYLFGVQ